jgi:hypothetical protein
METLKRWFSLPHFDDEEKSQKAVLLQTILLAVTLLLSIYIAVRLASGSSPRGRRRAALR